MAQFERGLIAALREESETLQNITDFFVPLMKHFSITFFWEQEKTDLKYTKDYIVAKESAAPNFDDTERAGIAADHSGMVKFEDPSSASFRLVVATLMRYCDEAPEVIQRRWSNSMDALAGDRHGEAMEKLRRVQTLPYMPTLPYIPTLPHMTSAVWSARQKVWFVTSENLQKGVDCQEYPFAGKSWRAKDT